MKALYQKIRALNGKNYGLYKSLADKNWDFGDFVLEFLHVQGDPFAPASRLLIRTKIENLGYSSEWGVEFERRLALSDFLTRKLSAIIAEQSSEKNAPIIFDNIGPEILVRNSLWIDNGELRACLQVRLPGDGRKIQSESAAELLTMTLPDLVSAALYHSVSNDEPLQKTYQTLIDRKSILTVMQDKNLVAFIANGAILPRSSGISQTPLTSAVPFESPKELTVELSVNGRNIQGMGIPKGITVITGGAFHGKSTLLQALASAVHPHIPGDGRENVVVDESALWVGVEDGRNVRNSDISALVRSLPGGISTNSFSTQKASGSTSEAANLMEAVEFGAKTFFIDEDSSAVNFLIRDSRVRTLLGDEREPLIPLTDRIQEFKDSGYSFVLVAGACGDFLSFADNIIILNNYRAEYANANFERPAKQQDLPPLQIPSRRSFTQYLAPLQKGLRPTSVVERLVKVKITGDALLQIGFLASDVSKIKGLVDKQQRLGAGYILLNLCQNADDGTLTIADAINNLYEKLRNVGFRNLPQGMSREMSLPRPIDLACALFRLQMNA
ncbi:MAG: ABC-ATPase domain-containing protein [Fibrobacter sp.]|nr:ABC-ATPase domain-containing protein [Fibrobacter sp.]